METFNKNILNRLENLLLDKEKNYDITKALSKALKIYNNTIHTTIKLEPEKLLN